LPRNHKKSRLKPKEQRTKTFSKSAVNRVDNNYPIFCFKHLCLKCNKDYKYYFNFIERLHKISQLDWNTINHEKKHGYGTEKMPIHKIKPDLPKFVTPDVKHLTVFRATGDNKVFLGLRKGDIFHVIFLEEYFGDVYDHN